MTRDSAFFLACAAGLVSAGAGGCVDAPEFYYGESLGDIDKLTLYDRNIGVYPNTSVLADPNNPFVAAPIVNPDERLEGEKETKWEIQSHAGPVAKFYLWATLNAKRPSGENQYYTALNLKDIYASQAVVVSPEDDPEKNSLARVRDLAIEGYQAVLDYFPGSVTYTAGNIPLDLATLAYEGLVALGGPEKVKGGWYLVETTDGGKRAVKP